MKNMNVIENKSKSKPKFYGMLKGEKISSKKEVYLNKDLKD